jgi:hypothetical protein
MSFSNFSLAGLKIINMKQFKELLPQIEFEKDALDSLLDKLMINNLKEFEEFSEIFPRIQDYFTDLPYCVIDFIMLHMDLYACKRDKYEMEAYLDASEAVKYDYIQRRGRPADHPARRDHDDDTKKEEIIHSVKSWRHDFHIKVHKILGLSKQMYSSQYIAWKAGTVDLHFLEYLLSKGFRFNEEITIWNTIDADQLECFKIIFAFQYTKSEGNSLIYPFEYICRKAIKKWNSDVELFLADYCYKVKRVL